MSDFNVFCYMDSSFIYIWDPIYSTLRNLMEIIVSIKHIMELFIMTSIVPTCTFNKFFFPHLQWIEWKSLIILF